MGMIPLPKKIDRKARFKAHMKEFFKNPEVSIGNLLDEFGAGNAYDLEYFEEGDKSKLKAVINDWINTLTAILDDDSYIFKYPNFYLPVTADHPRIVFLKDMHANGVRGDGFYGNLSNILAINSANMYTDPRNVLITAIHEYAHKQTRLDEVLPLSSLAIGSHITSWFGNYGFDEWAVGTDNEQLWHTKVMTYAEIRDVGDVSHYTGYKEWLDEIAVRLKSNIAVNSEYHNIESFWMKGIKNRRSVVDEIFTEKYQNYLRTFAWPHNKPIIKRENN